jgi:hypothetical protein
VPARIDEVAQIGTVHHGLEQAFNQSVGNQDGGYSQHGAVKPAGKQAGDGDGCAQYRRRHRRTRSDEPLPQAYPAAEPGNDRSIDGVIEPVRIRLMREEHAEDGDEDRAAGQQPASPGTGGGS